MKKFYLFTLLIVPLFVTAQTQKLPGSLDWERNVGGTKVDRAKTIVPTSDHGFLVVGLSFSNDGQVSGHHGTADSSDAWVVKLNSSGDIEWQQSYGGSNTDEFVHAIQVGNGDFICVGTSRSVDGDVTGLHTSTNVASDLWVVRINRYGVIQWSKVFGGSEEDHGWVIRKTEDGNYMVAGDARSNDFDVSGNHGGADIWVLKINGQGDLIWQKTYGNPNHQFTSSLTVTSDNNYIISGYQQYNGYPQVTGSPVYAIYEEAALKIDGQGNVLWEQYPLFTPGNPGPSRFNCRILELPSNQLIKVSSSINFVTAANSSWSFSRLNSSDGTFINGFGASASTPPILGSSTVKEAGPEAVQLLPDSTILTCLSAYVSSSPVINLNRISTITPPFFQAGFLYQVSYGGGALNAVLALENDEYVAAGVKNQDFWIIKVKALNQIKGKAFVDNNGNGVKEPAEPFFKYGFVESKKEGAVNRSNISNGGDFINLVDTGTYITWLTLNTRPYYTVSPVSQTSSFSSYKNKDSLSFAIVPIAGKNDLQLSLQSMGALRPGFNGGFRIDYSNVGTTVITNTVIKLVKPSVVSLISSSIPPSSTNADTLVWNIGSLSPFDGSHINLQMKIDPPPAVNLHDVLTFIAAINPIANDVTPEDNIDTLKQTVIGSFDPNDKHENHNGTLYIEQLQAGQPLTYTIRFQNMGTDTAFNIIIKDTLSDQLDIAALEMVSASHPYQFSLKDNKYAAWTFNDILLPDHNTNEPASHGYITYRIKPRNSLQLGDKIYNSASIYFDFNLPVQTNNHETVIALTPVPAPPTPVVSGLQLNYCKNAGEQKIRIMNLPTAASGITVTAKLDAELLTIAADSTVSFTVSAITGSTHNLTVTYSNVTDTKTTTASFTVTAAVSPEVDLSANITHVTNLFNPVIVTAANASGGGKNPLYTFAWNNSFTNIVQAESNISTLTINGSSLALGDNNVYVKMKTSEDCYMAQTNIDSITIRRDMSTGITDTDYPGQVITIYPNPVTGPLTINGLSTGKTYMFTIANLQGQIVLSKRVANQSTAELRNFKVGAGVYWLSIYDEKKNRLLGSVQLIKQ
ncbi:T9SS type A sorting domain-containing protein [Longitalea arenae]|uniref:T9SS type A sorting domain-containing protein n=1 Tax=Longitalea arenae TaxID=2812558 RepID=UPI00196843E6|nr:T9SS type A sorting domain-containing protein [Longitalea arenae]